MDFIEVESFIDGLNRRNREAWEQTRLLAFIIAQSNSTRTLKQTDILRFPWDEEEKKDTSVTDEEMQRLRAKAKEVESQLLLKTNDFDANLEKSKGSVNRFQGDISNIAKSVGSSFVKVAGGIGLAVSASESFMKIIRSTQTTSDEFDNTLNACKGTVDIFFQSLSSGSFEAFNNGVLNTISNLKELSALRDSLADAKLSMGFNNKIFETQLNLNQ